MGAEEKKSLNEIKKAHIKEHQEMQALLKKRSQRLQYRLEYFLQNNPYPSVHSKDLIEQEEWYLQEFKKKIHQYHEYLSSGGKQSYKALDLLQRYLAPLLQNQTHINDVLTAIPNHLFYFSLIYIIQENYTHWIIETFRYKKDVVFSNEVLVSLYYRLLHKPSLPPLTKFIENIITILELSKNLACTNIVLDILWDCLHKLHNDPQRQLSSTIASALHKKDIIDYAKKRLVDMHQIYKETPLSLIVFYFVQNPQRTIAQKRLQKSFRLIIQKLNANTESYSYQELMDNYQKLITFTQHDASWRQILEEETKCLENTEPDLHLWIQEQCRKSPVKSIKKSPETITIATLIRAIQHEDVEALAIIDNPAHALEIVELIQDLVHEEDSQIAIIDYQSLYQRLVASLTQEMSTLKQLLASIKRCIPSFTTIKSFKKRNPMAYSDWDNMIARTLDIISSQIPFWLFEKYNPLHEQWLSWLKQQQYYFLIKNAYIKEIFQHILYISGNYLSSSEFYELFEKWWENTPSEYRDKALDTADLEHLRLKITQNDIFSEEMRILCDTYMSKIYQLELFLSTICDKNPKFHSLIVDFTQLCQSKADQWESLKSLDSLAELFPQIFALSSLEKKDISHSKEYFGIITKLQENIRTHINKQIAVLIEKLQSSSQKDIDITLIIQNLSILQEIMQDYKQFFYDTDKVTQIWKQFQRLHDQYQTILHKWIDSESDLKVDQKHHEWQKIVSKTNLQEQLFNTYHVIEEHFIQIRLQKWIKQQITAITSDSQPVIQIQNQQESQTNIFPINPITTSIDGIIFIHPTFVRFLSSKKRNGAIYLQHLLYKEIYKIYHNPLRLSSLQKETIFPEQQEELERASLQFAIAQGYTQKDWKAFTHLNNIWLAYCNAELNKETSNTKQATSSDPLTELYIALSQKNSTITPIPIADIPQSSPQTMLSQKGIASDQDINTLIANAVRLQLAA